MYSLYENTTRIALNYSTPSLTLGAATESNSSLLNYYHSFSSLSVLLANIIYFLVLILNRKANKLSYMHMHQINLVGLLQGLLIVGWSVSRYLNVEDEKLNDALCFLSEILWGILKHVRAYSVMILAGYRYCAVFHNLIYKKISTCYKYLLLTVAITWFFPSAVFFITKYATKSTSSNMYCLDGDNKSAVMIYIYFSVTSLIGFVIPTIAVCVIYSRIRSELQKRYKRLKIIEMICPFNSNSSSSINQNERIKRNKRLMNQVFLINLFEIISFFNVIMLTIPIQDLLQNFDLNTFDLVLSSLNNFILAVIPFVTLYFMPFKMSCPKESAQSENN